MKPRIILFTVLFLILLFQGCQSPELTAAKVYIQQENYPAALEQLKVAEKKEPTNPHVFLTMGKLYAEMDSLDEMERAFSRAEELDSAVTSDITKWREKKRAEYFNKGRKFGESKKWEKAIENTEIAVRIDPEYADGWKNLAYFYEQVGDEEKTKEAYRKAYELEPLDQIFAKQVALNEFRDGDKDEAISILKELIDEGEPDVECYSMLAKMYASENEGAKADSILDIAETVFPDNVSLLFDHGALLFRSFENYEEAASYFERVLKLEPADRDALYNLSVTLFHLERFDESVALAERLVKENFDFYNGWLQYALSLKLSGQVEKGKAAEMVMEAIGLIEEGKFAEAIPNLEKVTSQFKEWCGPWALLKVCYEAAGDNDGLEKAQHGLDSCVE
ncbi:hypothetical protein DRQ36_06140 [bacterium]|nr:MAG: hypothetical protein DRQ36_06140 [bacterium]